MHTNTRAALLCPRAALRPTENGVTEPHAVQCCCAQPDHSTGQQQHAEKGRDIAEYKKGLYKMRTATELGVGEKSL